MPLLVQIDAAIHVAPGGRQLPVDLTQTRQPFRRDVAGEIEGQPFQGGEDRTALPHLGRVQRPYAEAAAHIGLENTFPGQPQQGLADGCAANPQLGREIGVADPAGRGKVSPLVPGEDGVVDLVAKRRAGDHEVYPSMGGILYTIFNGLSQVAPNHSRGPCMNKWLVPVLLAALTGRLAAQSEAALREYFEGKAVTSRLALPGTEDGVDIYPGTARPLDYPRYASRLKNYGTAIRSGEPVTVTKIRVKSKHIEFQLGGGGYGTFGDETSSNVSTPEAPKTKREKNLEVEVKRETDPIKKRAMNEELDDLRAERERENVRNRSAVAEAEEHRKQNVRERRLEGGSRFNIRYPAGVPAEALAPESVMTALAHYLDFEQTGSAAVPPSIPLQPAAQSPRSGLPRKGMLLQDVDALLGSAARSSERKEGTLRVQTREYATPDGRVTAEFVEGVLIRYRITSE
jgi:hypothetical protein